LNNTRFFALSSVVIVLFLTALAIVVSGGRVGGKSPSIDRIFDSKHRGKSLTIISEDGVTMYQKVYERADLITCEIPENLKHLTNFLGEELLICNRPDGEDSRTLEVNNISADSAGNCLNLTLAQKALTSSGFEDYSDVRLWKTASEIVESYSQDEIIHEYLENAYMQSDIWGLESASKFYFDKSLKYTNLREQIWLLTLASFGYPVSNDREAFLKRCGLFAYELYRSGRIDYHKYKSLRFEDIKSKKSKVINLMPDYTELILKELKTKRINMERDLIIHTSINLKTMKAAEEAIAERIKKYPKGIKAAMAVVNYENGGIEALAASDKWRYRTTKMKRQIGSTFKPIVYLTAISEGAMPNEIIVDKAYKYKMGKYVYAPGNFEDYFMGSIPMRLGLVHSLNNATIRLANLTGLSKVSKMAMNLGMKADIRPYLAMPLGIFPITPLNLAKVYGTFGSYGLKREMGYISEVKDRNGNTVYMRKDTPVRVAEESSTYQVVYIMKDVVRRGTARGSGLIWGTAAKTGTTDHYRDAWTVALFPPYAVVCWVGFDDHRSMGEKGTGGGRAAPIIAKFQKKIMKGVKKVDFNVPDGVVFRRVDARNGRVTGKNCRSRKSYLEAFKKETVPGTCYRKKVAAGNLNNKGS